VTIEAPAAIDRELATVVAVRGLSARRIDVVSPLGRAKGVRLAWRIDLADGRTLKLRHFGASEEARLHLEIRALLEPAFAPAIAQWDGFVVEEWIDGDPLADEDGERRVEEAGALLARLHRTRLEPTVAARVDTAPWLARAHSDLERLVASGALGEHDARALRVEVARRDPRYAAAVLVHLDFCAENMLIDREGRLRVVDNELVAVRPGGLDLGRTFHRWPMPRERWARFFASYRRASGAAPEPTGFWRIVAALTGARVFVERGAPLELTLALLRRFAAGEDLVDPPS
jgi:thiamine kinase-like enzyme